jgi:hypothetical protein
VLLGERRAGGKRHCAKDGEAEIRSQKRRAPHPDHLARWYYEHHRSLAVGRQDGDARVTCGYIQRRRVCRMLERSKLLAKGATHGRRQTHRPTLCNVRFGGQGSGQSDRRLRSKPGVLGRVATKTPLLSSCPKSQRFHMSAAR